MSTCMTLTSIKFFTRHFNYLARRGMMLIGMGAGSRAGSVAGVDGVLLVLLFERSWLLDPGTAFTSRLI